MKSGAGIRDVTFAELSINVQRSERGGNAGADFALVTWIVYLFVVHVRIATINKARWTAVLSVICFGVMLFNWIGVKLFMVGLHSYA